VDRLEAGRLGVDADALAAVLRAQVEGLRVGTVYREGKRLPLVVRVRRIAAHLARALQRAAARAAGRALGAARQPGAAWSASKARWRSRASAATAWRWPSPTSTARPGRLRRRGARGGRRAGRLPTGYWLEWGGEFENQQRAAARLALVVPVALG
jgi:cobalt-zinc-cadmium resistance protein CzcA